MKDQNVCGDLKGEVNHELRLGLDELVKYQLALVEKIDQRMGSDQLGILLRGSDKDRVMLTYELLNCLHNEVEEVRDWLPWKSWREYKNYNLQEHLPEIKMEVVDLMHFVIELMMCVGMTTEEMSRMFHAKHLENLNRQERGY